MKHSVAVMILSMFYQCSIAEKRQFFKKSILSGIVAVPLLMQQVWAEETLSVGAGLGAMYSGLVIKVGLKTNKQLKYLALGCPGYSYSSNRDDHEAVCGLGIGILRTDLFSAVNNKHGLGLHVGAVGTKRESNPAAPFGLGDMKAVYGAGVSYVYFWNGISAPGLNLGITPAIGFDNGARGSLFLQIGYQFK